MDNFPPRDSEPSELFAKLSSTEWPFELVDFPRKGPDGKPVGQVAMRVISAFDCEQAQADATKYVREKLRVEAVGLPGSRGPASFVESDHGYQELWNNELAVQLLSRACMRPNSPKVYAFAFADNLRNSVSADELAVLFNAFCVVKKNYGPISAELSEAEMEAWLDVLAEGGGRQGLAFFSLGALTDLLSFMASRISFYRKERSSVGSQLGESTPKATSDDSAPEPQADNPTDQPSEP